MGKKSMSKQEYLDQQYKWVHSLIDPNVLASVVDSNRFFTNPEEEDIKGKRQELKEKLIKLILIKVKKDLTPRQREAVSLFLMSKKQEHSATVVGVSQEAIAVRLKLGFKRLRKSCETDHEIQEILSEMKGLGK